MRFFVTLGVVTMATGLFVACGDDDGGDGNTAGTGGTGGRGGTGGTAGTAGTGGTAGNGNGGTAGNGNGGTAGNGNGGTAGNGNGGTAGTAGTAGTSGETPDAGDGGVNDGADAGDAGTPPCTGCLELRAVVDDVDDGPNDSSNTAFFQLAFDATNMSGATVTFRVAGLPSEENVNVVAFATDGTASTGSDFTFGPGDESVVTTEDGFVNLEVDISALTANNANFDDEDVVAVGVQLDYLGTIPDDYITVTALLDSVTFENDGDEFADLTFSDGAEGFALNQFAGSQDAEVIHHPE